MLTLEITFKYVGKNQCEIYMQRRSSTEQVASAKLESDNQLVLNLYTSDLEAMCYLPILALHAQQFILWHREK